MLGADPADPVLLSTSLVFDAGDVVDTALIYYRGDRFRFTVSVDLS
ncbi:UTRA domain-containing protein [Pseudonocardia sp. K10HN5]|uniref:UTRA domain-containing protein n=1 Tax=Pseudonocardia acidicola TaxID=2724939 RepID=A0ABX1S8M7_9PSEU|nr:UTRA domain-containing protein [Pseudonocardia acidicola]